MIKKYFADYIFISQAASQPFIENGELIADEISGKILSVLKSNKKNYPSVERSGDFRTIIIPGFINSHTHTDLTIKPDDKTPEVFSKWVMSLIEKRKSFSPDKQNRLRIKAFKEFVKSGTTLIGDIIPLDSFYNINDILLKTKLVPKVKGFIELRGLDPLRAPAILNELKAFYKKRKDILRKNENYFSLGISPHSIYSVSEELFKEIIKENSKIRLKVAIHASEHLAETLFISGNGGDIAVNLLPALNLSKFSKPL